jgi:DNA repair protein RadC
MAQLSLFPSTFDGRPAASTMVGEPADGRPPPYRVPIYRVTLVRESSITAPAPRLRGAQQAAALLRQYLGPVDREHFMVILLDRKNAPIGLNTVSIGSLTASVVHMREVFKPAIVANAAALMCCHNHPSNDPTPSREDRALTQRLVEAGKLLGIPLIDHIILGDGSTVYFSFAEQRLL